MHNHPVKDKYWTLKALPGLFLLILIAFPLSSAASQRRIIGGVSASSTAWPWMAALVDKGGDIYADQYCGGTLIDSRWVLTAAHCVHNYYGDRITADEIEVVLGSSSLRQDQGERISVREIVVHPGYDYRYSDNADIALLELETASFREPAGIFTGRSDLAGIQSTVIGWGVTDVTTRTAPYQLQQASVPIVSNAICNDAYTSSSLYDAPPVTAGMMCAGFLEGGRDSCFGDSGGPLMIRDGGEWKVAGITSWGEGCATPGFFGVYTRVSEYLDFIKGYVPLPSPPVRLYFPYVASDDTQETEIVIINTGPESVGGKIRLFDGSGKEMVGENRGVFLTPYGRISLVIGTEFFRAADIRYVLFETDADHVTGYERIFQSGVQSMSLPAVSELSAGDMYLPLTVTAPGWETQIHLLNTTSEARELRFRFENGHAAYRTLAAHESTSISVPSLLEETSTDGFTSVIIENTSGVIGLYSLAAAGADGRHQLAGFQITDHLMTEFSCFHLGGIPDWWTGLVMYNPWDTPVEAVLTPYADSGEPLAPVTVQVPGKQKYVALSDALHLPVQTAWFQVSTSRPVTGFDMIGSGDGNLMDGNNFIPFPQSGGILPVVEPDGWTAFVFLNAGDRTTEVTLAAYDENGVLQAEEVLVLSPHQRYLAMTADIFSGDPDRITHIRYTAESGLSAFLVNGSADGASMDSLPALDVTAWQDVMDEDDPAAETASLTAGHIPLPF